MKKFNFLQKLDNLKEFIGEGQVVEIYTEAEEIFGDLNEEIKGLKNDVKEKDSEIDDLKEEIEGFEERIKEFDSEPIFQFDNQMHNNIRTIGALEDLFKNLDYVPVDEIETLVKKYAVL